MAEPGHRCHRVRPQQHWHVYQLQTDGGLYVNGALGWANSKDFALANDGSLYLLNANGSLDRRLGDGKWQNKGTGVSKFALAGSGTVYQLRTDGGLYVNGALSWANSKDFALANDGSLYLLNANGSLDQRVNGSWQNVGTGVSKFALAGSGAVYQLRADGGLYVNGSLSWANSRDFALANDGSLYLLNANGVLQKLTGSSWQTLSTGVISFTLETNGTCHYQSLTAVFFTAWNRLSAATQQVLGGRRVAC